MESVVYYELTSMWICFWIHLSDVRKTATCKIILNTDSNSREAEFSHTSRRLGGRLCAYTTFYAAGSSTPAFFEPILVAEMPMKRNVME